MTTLFGLVHSGDSIAGSNNPASYFLQAYGWTGVGDSGSPVSQKWATYYNGNVIGRGMGIAGTGLNGVTGYPDLVPMALIDIDPIIPVGYAAPPNDRPRKYIFTTAIGTNDSAVGSHGTGNAALYAADVAACCVLRKNAGFDRVGICTILPRSTGMLESDRLTYNNTVKGAGWAAAHGVDYIIDLASETTMGNPATCANTIYYADGLHPTAAGHALLAPIYLAGANALMAMADVVVISGTLAAADAIDNGSIFADFKKATTRQRSPLPYYSRRDYGWVSHAPPPLTPH